MNNIPKSLRADMAADPFYSTCARAAALGDHECVRDPLRPGKPVDWEHALIFAGKQLQERFAIIPICWWAHRGPGLNKDINIWIALNRASPDELLAISKKGGRDYFRYKAFLNNRYGVYKPVDKGMNNERINYGYLGDNEGVTNNRY